MKAVLDASILVARFIEADVHHADCMRTLTVCQARDIRIIVPAILPAELAGAIVRKTGDASLALVALAHIRNYSWLRVRLTDLQVVDKAARLAARHALRGADSFYLALAIEQKCPLITLDEELLSRVPPGVKVMRPVAWLATVER